VLAYTRGGQVRLSTRKRDLTLVESVSDPAQAIQEWQEAKHAGAGDVVARSEFYRSRNARALLIWGLAQPSYSADRRLAVELLSAAPTHLKDGLVDIQDN
jgi:hypothetical protein